MTISDFGVLGLGVMGQNLALNLSDHGVAVAVYNRSPDITREFIAANPALRGHETLEDFIAGLAQPRRVLLMIKAGAPVDDTLAALIPLLDKGDIVIDGGNSWFQDTRRREEQLRAAGLRFFGMGVSGGEEGARHGPSLMPGGDPDAFSVMKPQLEAIAAKTETGPCVAWCGPDGAGHFVKMVHNGIEYADMQLIAEAYGVLRWDLGYSAPQMADIFRAWNQGPLESFLIEITARVLDVTDEETGRPLTELVADKAGQKGTGRWTVQIAQELGVAVPSIAAAVDSRIISADRAGRADMSARLPAPASAPMPALDREARTQQLHDALLAAKICAYTQGLQLIAAASRTYGWGTDLGEMARIWTGGCIIRARLLREIQAAYVAEPALPSLLHSQTLAATVGAASRAWRSVVARGVATGMPLPALSATLAWVDQIRATQLPTNLTAAQRDAFGAHTYERTDRPGAVHSNW